MKKALIIIVTTALLAATALPVSAGWHGGNGQHGRHQGQHPGQPHNGWYTNNTADSGTAITASSITAEQARSTALRHAGVSASDATFVNTVRHYKGNLWVYKVVFRTDSTRYVYEINASTGSVLANYSSPCYFGTTASGAVVNYIGDYEVRCIALEHCGIAEGDITRYESSLKNKSSGDIYKVELRTDSVKYEYLIDAVTGDVVEWEQK